MTSAVRETAKSTTFIMNRILISLLVCMLPLLPSPALSGEEVVQPWWWAGQISAVGKPEQMLKGKKIITKLTDNVYWFRSPYYENTLIVVGDEDVLITDTFNDTHALLLKKEIAKITDKPVTKIVLSHEHFDHIGGTRHFADAQLIAQKNILPFLVFDPLERAPDRIDVTFDSELSIDMGATKVELRYWGMTEGVANIVIHLPKERIALLSDLHAGDRSLIPLLDLSDTNMLGLRLVLNEVSKWDLKYVLDSHTPVTDPGMMREYAGFLNDLHDAVLRVVRKESDTADALELWHRLQYLLPGAVKLPKYKDWYGYEEYMPANVLWMATSILYGAL